MAIETIKDLIKHALVTNLNQHPHIYIAGNHYDTAVELCKISYKYISNRIEPSSTHTQVQSCYSA